MSNEGDWLSGRSDHKRQMQARRRMSGEAGKGDQSRITNTNKYRLGMRLIQLSEEGSKDTDEYRKTLSAWRKA